MSHITHFYIVKFKAWKSGGVRFWTNITSAEHVGELRSISCWVARVWRDLDHAGALLLGEHLAQVHHHVPQLRPRNEPVACKPRTVHKKYTSHQLFERSSKPTVDIKDTESLSDVHFCCKGINLCRITDHVTKRTPRLSAISSLLINILLISFVLQNIVGTNCNCIVCPHLTCH